MDLTLNVERHIEKKSTGKFYWMCLLVFLFAFEPKIFTQYRFTALFFGAINLAIFFYFIVKIFFQQKRIRDFVLIWWLYRVFIVVLMIINGNLGDIDQWGYLTIIVSNCMFLLFECDSKHKLASLFNAATFVGLIYISVNLFTIYYFKNGIIPDRGPWHNPDNDYYFLGIKDAYTSYCIIFILCGLINWKLTKKAFLSLLVCVLAVFTIFIAKITTGIIMLFVMGLLYVFFRKKINLSIRSILVATLFVNVLLLFFNIQNRFSFLFETILNKDVSLSSRVYIWETAKSYFASNPLRLIVGNGIKNGGAWVPHDGTYFQPHNSLLTLIFETGLPGTALFYYFLSYPDKFKNKKIDVKKSEIYNIVIIVIIAVMISSLVSNTFSNSNYYFPFLIAYYLKTTKINLDEE